MSERLLTAREIGDLLGLSPSSVLDRFQRGELPGFRLGEKGGPVRFRGSEVESWLESCRRGPLTEAGIRAIEAAFEDQGLPA